jgi:hypothetical protein
MLVALYINLTTFEKPTLPREVRGMLEKLK